MSRNVLSRLLSCSSAYLAFIQCFVVVAAFSQHPESGPWSPWAETSQCSRTCGGGVAHQDRICMDMRPDGRHPCQGLSRRYYSCNIQDCPVGSKDFRSLQCARFNSVPDSGNRYYGWEPYHHPNNPCKLYCMPKGGKFYEKSDTKVIDGTRCRNDGSLDICVAGQCKPVGCDKILGSTKTEDQCGVCGGDGSTCSVVKGVFDKDNFEIGYNDILLIPVGATSILIQKKQPVKNYLSVRDTEGRFYLNGNWKIEYPRQLRIGGTLFHYERKPPTSLEPETLRSRGPTTQAIFVVLLYQEKNLGISYEYGVPVAVRTPAPDSYLWKTDEFEECSQTCGGGVQHRSVRCVRESDRDIADERLCDPLTKPAGNATCNNAPCPSNWKVGEWSECSQECDGGTQFRIVYCHQMKDENTVLVPDEICEGEKPLFMRSCNVDRECPGWTIGEWSECSVPCGGGERTRMILCLHEKEIVDNSQCNPAKKPFDEETCNMAPCNDDVCSLEKEPGPCLGYYRAWYYDASDNSCKSFIYGGCDGNENRFEKRGDCEQRCVKNASRDVCRHPADPGPCLEKHPRWFYYAHTQNCFPFVYGGCDGNTNRFKTQEICLRFCTGIKETKPGEEVPYVTTATSTTTSTTTTTTTVAPPIQCPPSNCAEIRCPYRIEVSIDANRCSSCRCFNPCEVHSCPEGSRCAIDVMRTSGVVVRTEPVCRREVCRLPKEPGPCRNFTIKWFFDLGYGGCSRFWYGGCDGNGNVFESQEDCENVCVKPDGPEVCLLPMVAGSCDAKIPSWYFDAGSKTCETFTYGGCLGNNNRFSTKTDCEAKCISKQPPKPVDRCSLAKDEGGCDSAIIRWYYNGESAQCEQFYYGGCKGNTNRFESRRDCEKACMPSVIKVTDVCRLPHEIGPCNEFRERWYFDYDSGQCHRFIFGGCSGNENNFPSYAECEGRCGARPEPKSEEIDNFKADVFPEEDRFGEDCKGSAFGCCDDGISTATGPDKEGCIEMESSGNGELIAPCEESVTKCCLDGRTPARGPNYEGCPCDSTRFGCCEDGRTVAPGPRFEGCPCDTTPHGCCADGYTAAKGPRYQGCPSVHEPKPEVSTVMPTESSCNDNPQIRNCELVVKMKHCNNKYYSKYCCASCMRAGQMVNKPQV